MRSRELELEIRMNKKPNVSNRGKICIHNEEKPCEKKTEGKNSNIEQDEADENV